MLEEYFGTWGTVVDAVVMRDPQTKRCRGFGFVTYDEPSSVDECLTKKSHVIGIHVFLTGHAKYC